MVTEAKSTNYWISSTALYIQLNAMGEPDYIQCSVVSGASVLCYMSNVPGLGYDAGHNYQRWTLAAYPSIFPDSERKYVYIAIPRQPTTDNNQATVVFPGEKIDIYGKTIPSSGTEGVQIGNEAYYYIFTGGIISAVKTDADNTRKREWEQHFECGKLATDEAIASGGEGAWWRYNSVSDTITFLKEILKATFNELSAKVAHITSLFLGGHELKGVADSNDTLETSNDTVVTPQYLGQFGVKHFLAKDKDDTTAGLITFLKGLRLGKSTKYYIDGNGNAILSDVIVKLFKSFDFRESEQTGFAIKQRSDGKYQMLLTDLIVWGKAVFNELETRKVSYAGGNINLSGAGSKLVKVVPVVYNREVDEYITSTDEECDGWKCYFLADDGTTATQNWWMVGDQARCQTFNIKPGVYDNVSNKEYWRCVVAVSSESEYIVDNNGESLYGDKKFDWVILSRTNCLVNSDIPASGDAIVLDGHQVKTGEESSISRTNVLMLESSGADTPRIVGYKGITDFTHKDKEVFIISPSNVTISSSVFKFKSASGQDITIINDRGAYDAATDYYYYDRVSYDNAYWTFIYNGDNQPVKGITPTEEAVNGTVYWRKDLSGGIKGDDGVAYQVMITSDTGTVMINGSGKMTLNATLLRNGEDISDTISNSSWSWWRQSADAEDDAVWNTLHEGVGRSCLITRDDVSRQAQFGCRVYISEVKTIDSNI